MLQTAVNITVIAFCVEEIADSPLPFPIVTYMYASTTIYQKYTLSTISIRAAHRAFYEYTRNALLPLYYI